QRIAAICVGHALGHTDIVRRTDAGSATGVAEAFDARSGEPFRTHDGVVRSTMRLRPAAVLVRAALDTRGTRYLRSHVAGEPSTNRCVARLAVRVDRALGADARDAARGDVRGRAGCRAIRSRLARPAGTGRKTHQGTHTAAAPLAVYAAKASVRV